MKLPYTLVYDPVTNQAATYDGTHRLITFTASQALITYTLRYHVKVIPWQAGMPKADETRHPIPPWATPQVLERAKFYYIRRGGLTDAEFLAIPAR